MKIRKVFATDMDGTFLKRDHRFDANRLRAVLAEFKKKGYLFVVASGRPLANLQVTFADFVDDIAIVAENGAVVAYRDKVIYQAEPMDKQLVLELTEGIQQSPYGDEATTVLSGLDSAYVLDSAPASFFKEMGIYYPKLKTVADFADVKEDIIKLVTTVQNRHFDEALAWLNTSFDGVTAVTTGINFVDIILDGSNKGVGLQHLCEYFGVTAADLVAFGDNQNDLEMLEFAGTAIATENAREEVKAVADQVIGDCDSESVMAYLEAVE